jgi:hypothetical protein
MAHRPVGRRRADRFSCGFLETAIPLLPMPLGSYAHLLPPSWTAVINQWLAEDTPSFDYAGFVVGEQDSEAFLFGKQPVRLVHTTLPTLSFQSTGRIGWCSLLRRGLSSIELHVGFLNSLSLPLY